MKLRVSGYSLMYSLWASSPRHSSGWTGKWRTASNYISRIWIPPLILLWLPIDWLVRFPPNQCKVEMSMYLNKHWKTCAKGNVIITNVISANQHFASTFWMQGFKSQRCSCKLSFVFLPCCYSALESLLTDYLVHKSKCTAKKNRPVVQYKTIFLPGK